MKKFFQDLKIKIVYRDKYLINDLKHFRVMLGYIIKDHKNSFRAESEFWSYIEAYSQARLQELHK